MPAGYTHEQFCEIVYNKHPWIKQVVGTYYNSRTPIKIECINGHIRDYDPKKLTKTNGIKGCLICKELKYGETKEQYEANPKLCEYCNQPIPFNQTAAYTRAKRFCSVQCANKVNNQLKRKPMNYCLNCGKETKNIKYCSTSCQVEYEANTKINKWKNNEWDGSAPNGSLSKTIRTYLLKQNNYSCQLCGWNKQNLVTGTVPLEIHHIDGNYRNNRPENLMVLCPNCHSLTPNFKALNTGNGREDRK